MTTGVRTIDPHPLISPGNGNGNVPAITSEVRTEFVVADRRLRAIITGKLVFKRI